MLFDAADYDAHEAVHFASDAASGLQAIIAVHSTHLGPAAGGCRWWTYADDAAALTDALRLSRGMSYKNAMAGLPMGGGKAVILKGAPKTEEMLEAFGSAIDGLGGRYVTAEDVGMSDADMTVIARRTRHVSGLPVAGGAAGGNPGPSTAEGVFVGMRAAVRHKLGRDLAGTHVAVQGLGSVGHALVRKLAAAGAKLSVADIDEARAARVADEVGATLVDNAAIMTVAADVFSPNALGAILTEFSIARLDVAVVAGAANNQLATPADGARVAARGILYAPDYVINAGGIINVATEYLGSGDAAGVAAQIARIEGRLADIFAEADASGRATDAVADAMARKLIGRG
ncbi:Leu/Phe/Val dehydrogenase [Glacieibacterium frigidum]|uniref:Glu/Leu/Phe/Val dehydrogenase n=1 Tax=Glacieibacterium frigidum TaxID=2593303 RepID=A0A552UI93_9SPHN|nr:Glu/Leu/Phe/Val dehydrogenase dimerization domain-containing protein [Glacieibacterium frigidum]TRW17910.1 Glu/Leu/Phe/Val dehydrogenase [Glacieibacterium frigidum]